MLARYSERQKALLDKMAPLVKPGGILVYAVCSTEQDEGQAVIEYFRERQDNFRLDAPAETNPGTDTPLFAHGGILKTYPHRHNMDAFFAARFRRI